MRQLLAVLVGIMLAGPIVVGAQTVPNLAGTWTLDSPAGGRGGRGQFAGFATATRLVINQSVTEVIVESNTGTEQSVVRAVYKLDGSQNTVPGPLGWETRAKAAWDGGKLMVTITRAIEGPAGPMSFEIKDAYSVSGSVLTLERTQGKNTLTLVYNRS